MDIEIIETEDQTPIKELLTYLNDNIYSKMSAKDVKQIKESSLCGDLLNAIQKYSNAKVVEALEKERRCNPKGEQDESKPTYRQVYPKGRKGHID